MYDGWVSLMNEKIADTSKTFTATGVSSLSYYANSPYLYNCHTAICKRDAFAASKALVMYLQKN